jgi:hypothetical protein
MLNHLWFPRRMPHHPRGTGAFTIISERMIIRSVEV